MAYSLLLGTLDVHKSICFHIQKLKHFFGYNGEECCYKDVAIDFLTDN